LSDEDVHKGYAVDFLSLTMHAISRDEDAYPQPCIYSQVCFETFLSPKMRFFFSEGIQYLQVLCQEDVA
jgi:hypothetical protein